MNKPLTQSVVDPERIPYQKPQPRDMRPDMVIHDAMAFASLLVGDSQSMAAESAILGVPSVRLSSWAGRIPYLVEIEERYGLTFEFGLDYPTEFLQKVDPQLVGWRVGRRAYSQTTLEVGELVHSIGKSADAELNKPFDQCQLQRGEFGRHLSGHR